MSRGFHKIDEIDYNVDNLEMGTKTPVAAYVERIYLAWLNSIGQVRSQREFSELLGMDRQRFNNYYNGKRTNMDYATAVHVAKIAAGFGAENPYEILEILGYPVPGVGDLYARVSPLFSGAMRAALNEINEKILESGVEPDSPEAWEIARSVLARIGLGTNPNR
jgi:transcriptional regulator with XRE-family HTH domain